MTEGDERLFERIEAFYDAVPRLRARAEAFGRFVLFVSNGPSHPYYARPVLGGTAPASPEDIAAVRARQRELGLPQAFEWTSELTPWLLPSMEAAGLSVLHAPLLVLDPRRLPDPDELAAEPVRLLDPASARFSEDLSMRRAVAAVSFRSPGTQAGKAGAAERDLALQPPSPASLELETQAIVRLQAAHAVLESANGVLASGSYQRTAGVCEIVGVATLPNARRRGLGAAVTAALSRHAITTGAELVFLSAGSEEIARVYARVGFRRIGTACIAEPA
ncbi:MAG: GNAT family N-acetyltransferase [Deltaproteobacteria bacterium]